MKIHCYKCSKYLGDIRDATLRKNTYYVCEFCASKTDSNIADIFGGIFGGKK